MKIYRVESDYGTDNSWTVGYYSTLDKAVKKCKYVIGVETQMILEEDLNMKEIEEVVFDDYTGPMVYGINCKLNGTWMFGCYVYQIEIDDNE